MPAIQPPSTDTLSPDGVPIPGPVGQIKPDAVIPPDNTPPPKEDEIPPAPDTKGDDGPDLNINDFLKVTGKEPQEEHPKADKDKEDENKDKEDKKPDDLVPKEEDKDKTPEIKDEKPKSDVKLVTQPRVSDLNARDYTGIDEVDVPVFKKMGNEAFNKFKPLYVENKTIKTELESQKAKIKEVETSLETLRKDGPQLPESYLEHPNAFVLTPEFNQLGQNINQANAVINHWNEQIDAVSKGATEIQMLGYDSKNGQYVLTDKIPTDRASELKVIGYLNHAQNKLQEYNGKLSALQQTHVERNKQATGEVTKLQSAIFAQFDKPEMKPVYDPIIKQEFESLPPILQKSVAGQYIARANVMMRSLAQLVEKVQTEKAALIKGPISKPKPNNGPTGEEIDGDGGRRKSALNEDVTTDDFERVKNGY